MKTTAILTATLGLTLGSLHAQTVPPFINYQGRVTDSNGDGLGTGTPVNRKVIFRIFDASTGGTRLYSEQHTVTISNGEFSVLLGNGTNANYDGAPEVPLKTETPLDTVFTSAGITRYVEIVVDNGDGTLNAPDDAPILPRQQITSTAYSFRARSADTIASGTDLQLNGSANYGLGYYGATRLFNGTAVDGPVLFGQAGGALGSVNGGTKNIALRWNAAGAVGIGSADLTGAAATTKLVLQGDDANTVPLQLNIRGNTDTNKRLLLGYNTSSNYGALQAYNGASNTTKLLLNPIGSTVGIGTSNPTSGAALEVNGSVQANTFNLPSTGSATVGVINSNGSRLVHTYGTNNFFAGQEAGNFTTASYYNTSIGALSLSNNTVGSANTASGYNVLERNTSGNNNTAYGYQALSSNTTGSSNIALGASAGGSLTGSNNIAIGNSGAASASNTIWLGKEGTHTATLLAGNVGIGIGTTSPPHKLSLSSGNYYQDAPVEWQDVMLIARSGTVRAGISMNTAGTDLNLFTGTSAATPRMTITSGGDVGIGTSSPTKGKLEISGKAGSAPLGAYSTFNASSPPATYYGTYSGALGAVSVYASNYIAAEGFLAFSDERIKQVEGRSDASMDLATLMGVEITDYTYIDTVAKGTRKYKKVVAQQVEKVFPLAVIRSTDEIPDIFQKASVEDGWIILKTNLKKGELVRILDLQASVTENNDKVHEVVEIGDGKFRTNISLRSNQVFVYGRQVKDFRSVDYEAISMLNVSATQELARKLDEKNTRIADLEKRLATLEAKDQARDAKLSSIEALLSSPDKASTETVSLKNNGAAE